MLIPNLGVGETTVVYSAMLNDFLKKLHANPAISWRTHAPFALSEVFFERIGFADIPVCSVEVACKERSGMVPIVRQFVYHELISTGLSEDAVQFTPSVCIQRQRHKFLDLNESSPTKGKNKMGMLCRFDFEIEKDYLGCFEWKGRRGQIKRTSN